MQTSIVATDERRAAASHGRPARRSSRYQPTSLHGCASRGFGVHQVAPELLWSTFCRVAFSFSCVCVVPADAVWLPPLNSAPLLPEAIGTLTEPASFSCSVRFRTDSACPEPLPELWSTDCFVRFSFSCVCVVPAEAV